jgi:hypothetical protein
MDGDHMGEHGRWAHGVETLHVSGVRVAHASKCVLGCPPKCDMFQWVVGFEVQVSRLMFHGV